jgi:hypothetical protein
LKSESGNPQPVTERPGPRWAEAARWLILLGSSLWLSHPYFSPRLIGTPDALWYHNSLADVVTQFRGGVFPVYVGQTDYSFNGAVFPLRAAPCYQYLAGLLDLATGRSLGFMALQHLVVVATFVAGAFACYGALAWLAPTRRWTALGLSLLYVMCPGVAGLFYAQDLYMSGMTIPWVPLAFAALVKSFDDDSLAPRAVLGASLAALWWAHSPIALWSTLIATLGQLFRWAARRPDRIDINRACLAAGIFCALAAYPIASVFLLRTPGESIVPYTMDRQLLLQWVRGSFPSSIEPIDTGLPALSYIQLGYGLWCVLLVSAAFWLRVRLRAAGVLLASVAFMIVLVFPVPGLTRELWLRFPETLVGMTLYWPMQRFYILIAAATVVAAQRIFAEFSFRKIPIRIAGYAGLLAAMLWSAGEASKLVQKAAAQDGTAEDSRRWSLTENVAIQRHSYGLFERRPDYYSHGVVDPRMEAHLLDPATGGVVASDYDIARSLPARDDFRASTGANPGILNLDPPLTLQPGVRYLLTFDFARVDTNGLLQMIGPQFFREYTLPQSGDSKSFGSGPGNEKSIAVWTSLPQPETVRLRFIPEGGKSGPGGHMGFSKFALKAIDGASLPIRVESLVPYTAVVRSPGAALLESPRMFVPGYTAEVNGSPVAVSESPEGLVAFPVPAGESRVVLRFTGPLLLRAAFWLSATGWLLAALWLLVPRRAALSRNPA